jgi:EAL domain-containing protein (putative c-di-GMP-specific phosphodiesterase class I)
LQRLAVDTLKIDGTFVQEIENDKDGGTLAKAVIAVAHALGLAVTAEGVETPGQAAFLEAHGCDRLQGQYFSAPCAPEELLDAVTPFSSGLATALPGQHRSAPRGR